jgi:hypothetical protein
VATSITSSAQTQPGQHQSSIKLPVTASLIFRILKFWMTKKGGVEHQGEKWIWKSAKELQQELFHHYEVQVSLSTIERALRKLESLNLIVRQQLKKSNYFRTYFYTLGETAKKFLGIESTIIGEEGSSNPPPRTPDGLRPATSQYRNVTADVSTRNSDQKSPQKKGHAFKEFMESIRSIDRKRGIGAAEGFNPTPKPTKTIQIGRYQVLDDGMWNLA